MHLIPVSVSFIAMKNAAYLIIGFIYGNVCGEMTLRLEADTFN